MQDLQTQFDEEAVDFFTPPSPPHDPQFQESQQVAETPDQASSGQELSSPSASGVSLTSSPATSAPELPVLPPMAPTWADEMATEDSETAGAAASLSMLSTQSMEVTQPTDFQIVLSRSARKKSMDQRKQAHFLYELRGKPTKRQKK